MEIFKFAAKKFYFSHCIILAQACSLTEQVKGEINYPNRKPFRF